MADEMTAVELSAFLDSVVPPFEKYADLLGKAVQFKNQHTITCLGDRWLQGTVRQVDVGSIVIGGVPYSYDGLEVYETGR